MTKICLSVCIATYNRAGYIRETLDSIIPQLTDEVELLVVDGASTDNTEEVMRGYQKQCDRLRYVRLAAKGGFDYDYNQAVDLARGEYCWLFADDDLLKPGAIKAVLSEVHHNYSLIVVNSEVKNKDFTKIISKKHFDIERNELYDNASLDPLFRRAISYMTFIGCVVIKREVWLQREKERYFGSYYIHVGVVFQAPLPGSTLLIAEPYITIRLGNAQWSAKTFEIGMSKWPKLLSSFDCLSRETRRPYLETHSWRIFKKIIFHRARKEYTLKDYQRFIAVDNSPLWWKAIACFVAITPSAVVKFCLFSYFGMFNRGAIASWELWRG